MQVRNSDTFPVRGTAILRVEDGSGGPIQTFPTGIGAFLKQFPVGRYPFQEGAAQALILASACYTGARGKRGATMTDILEGSVEQRNYLSYLLRLWRTGDGEGPMCGWSARGPLMNFDSLFG